MDITWTGNGSDNQWTTAGNWDAGQVPGLGDNAIFSNATEGNSTIVPSTLTCLITINPNASAQFNAPGSSFNAPLGIVLNQYCNFNITFGDSNSPTSGASFYCISDPFINLQTYSVLGDAILSIGVPATGAPAAVTALRNVRLHR